MQKRVMWKSMRLFFLLLIFFNTHAEFGQSFILSGKISAGNEPLPFANIYVKGTTQGVNSNDEGKYQLKLPAGEYVIVYQYVGYGKQEMKINLTENKVLNVTLKADAVTLNEVVINAGEDPAYPIMRKAIKKRKFYSGQISEYSCQSYIKGLERLINIPEKLKKLIKMTSGEKIDSTDLGVIYLSESESNYYFKKPGLQKEIMFSSRVSGSTKSFSFNQLSQMKFNFYDNLVTIRGISDRPFVSPLNANAFFYYRFILLGTINEEGHSISKIKVIPKRKNDPCFSGVIYIQDNTWRLTGIDLYLTQAQKINFVDTLTIKQLHAPIAGDSVWMPVNHNFSFSFKFMGITGNGYFNAIVKNFNLNPGKNEKFFNNEILVIEDGANKKDSAYWNANRPVPLTREETVDYRNKDSTEKITDTPRYKDSVDKIHNKPRAANFLIGYSYNRSKTGISFSIPGIITNGVQYNTVEGLNLGYVFAFNKEYENLKAHKVNGKLRYGFSNYLWGGELGYNYFYNPKKFSRAGIRIKSIVEQYNRSEPISPLVNSAYTLLVNDNFMKLFKETGAEASYFSELVNGVFANAVVAYMRRDPLSNSTALLLIDDKNKLFTSNDPQHADTQDSLWHSNNAFTAEVTMSFRFKQKYITVPNQKIVTGSRYPRLSISYKKAVPVLGAIADYDLASAMVNDEISLGLFGRLSYRIRGGAFISYGRLFFTDYRHFTGNQTILNTSHNLNCFRLLPYYTYSADRWFAEAHAEHHFNGFILNKIPLLKKLKVKEIIGAHFLSNNRISNYYEINFALENIFKIIRFDYVLGYGIGNKVRQGFTIGLNMGF